MSKHPNALPQSKSEYVKRLIIGRERRMIDVALMFYHSEIPLDDALKYITTLENKWKGQPND